MPEGKRSLQQFDPTVLDVGLRGQKFPHGWQVAQALVSPGSYRDTRHLLRFPITHYESAHELFRVSSYVDPVLYAALSPLRERAIEHKRQNIRELFEEDPYYQKFQELLTLLILPDEQQKPPIIPNLTLGKKKTNYMFGMELTDLAMKGNSSHAPQIIHRVSRVLKSSAEFLTEIFDDQPLQYPQAQLDTTFTSSLPILFADFVQEAAVATLMEYNQINGGLYSAGKFTDALLQSRFRGHPVNALGKSLITEEMIKKHAKISTFGIGALEIEFWDKPKSRKGKTNEQWLVVNSRNILMNELSDIGQTIRYAENPQDSYTSSAIKLLDKLEFREVLIDLSADIAFLLTRLHVPKNQSRLEKLVTSLTTDPLAVIESYYDELGTDMMDIFARCALDQNSPIDTLLRHTSSDTSKPSIITVVNEHLQQLVRFPSSNSFETRIIGNTTLENNELLKQQVDFTVISSRKHIEELAELIFDSEFDLPYHFISLQPAKNDACTIVSNCPIVAKRGKYIPLVVPRDSQIHAITVRNAYSEKELIYGTNFTLEQDARGHTRVVVNEAGSFHVSVLCSQDEKTELQVPQDLQNLDTSVLSRVSQQLNEQYKLLAIAQSLDRALQSGIPLSITDLAIIFANASVFSRDGASTSLGDYITGTDDYLLPLRNVFLKNGVLHIQCDAAALLTTGAVKEYFYEAGLRYTYDALRSFSYDLVGEKLLEEAGILPDGQVSIYIRGSIKHAKTDIIYKATGKRIISIDATPKEKVNEIKLPEISYQRRTVKKSIIIQVHKALEDLYALPTFRRLFPSHEQSIQSLLTDNPLTGIPHIVAKIYDASSQGTLSQLQISILREALQTQETLFTLWQQDEKDRVLKAMTAPNVFADVKYNAAIRTLLVLGKQLLGM